jgi:hypothetical protein
MISPKFCCADHTRCETTPLEETEAYNRKYAYIFQMNNGLFYTSEPGHELDEPT